MSLKSSPTILIENDLYQMTWKDVIYNGMNNYLYSIGRFKELTDKGKVLKSIGKDASFVYEELYYYKCLINYFINAKETLTKSGITDFAKSKLEYKLECIRKTIFCKYKSTKIFDDLYIIWSGISRNSLTGLDYMILDPNSVYGSELLINREFSLPLTMGNVIPNWFREDGITPMVSSGDESGGVVDGQFLFGDITGNRLSFGKILTIGKTYILTFNWIEQFLDYDIELYDDIDTLITFSTIGVQTYTFTARTDFIVLYGNSGVIVDNFSLIEVIEVDNNGDNDFIII